MNEQTMEGPPPRLIPRSRWTRRGHWTGLKVLGVIAVEAGGGWLGDPPLPLEGQVMGGRGVLDCLAMRGGG